MGVFMARTAHDQSLAPPFGHERHPCGFVPLSWLFQISEFADVMNLQPLGCSAQLAASSNQPSDQLIAFSSGQDGSAVDEHLTADRACRARGGHPAPFQRFAFRTSWNGHPNHLPPFALLPALPDSLAGRYPCDYYGGCVTLGLSPRRRSHVRLRCTYRA
jgi:hypothetical protein